MTFHIFITKGYMLLTILSGLIFSCLIAPLGRLRDAKWSMLLPVIPLSLFAYFVAQIPAISPGDNVYEHTGWVSTLGVDFDFKLDGLSLLFALLITGIGTAIFVYARSYMKGHIYFSRFFAYLLLFMSAMLGVVLADNILLLFIFWELTSISSFFLIGFNNDNAESRKSALTSLGITGLGGFFLLAAFVMLGNISGTYIISELVHAKDIILDHPLYPLVVLFVCIGAFTKSAQFPFHFWLPGAMKAPTPVSAYLHSATMVKAGVYLLARFTPVVGGTELWSYALMAIGGITMVYASIHSLFRLDLKSILAYSTIAALGVLTFLIGLGTQEAMVAATVFILAHALYKAVLFLVTGIVDHETGTRDVTVLSGLGKLLLPVAIASVIAAASSAGLPFMTFGFIGKDLIYEATLHYKEGEWVWILTGMAITANIGIVTAGLMAGVKPFFGKLPAQFDKIHMPPAAMWMPPLVLSILSIAFGLLPWWPGKYLTSTAANAIHGTAFHQENLAFWHGPNLVFLLSIVTLAIGVFLYVVYKPSLSRLQAVEKLNSLSPQRAITGVANNLLKLSAWLTRLSHSGYLRAYHLKIILFAEGLLAYKLWTSGPISVDFALLTKPDLYEIAVVLVLAGALSIMVSTSSRLTAVVAMSVIGYCICLIFVFYSAPDLAMTQFTIDTLSTVLFVLVLYRLPTFINFASKKVQYRDAAVAIGFGVILSLIALKVWAEPIANEISNFYGENAYILAKGKNVVNVILVDFRGLDTLFETVVLSIAALGVYSLIRLRLKPTEKE